MRTLIVLALATSIARGQPAMPRIDAAMAGWARKDGPGCAVAVIQNGKTVHARGYGMADLERAVPISADTVFDIGSTSKQFTAASIFLLAAEGKLRLADDIRKHVPELPALGKAPVTIRHLLHHTGGLRDYEALLILGGQMIEDVATSQETIAALARQKALDFEPGSKHQYSNTGYFVLAQIVERASKLAMAKFADDRIFKPLGMARTIIYDDHTRIVPGRAIGYAPRPGGGWKLEMSQWEQTGDGSVLTTVLDLAKWDANFYDAKLGGRALIDALLERGKLADGKVLDYASGLVHGTYRGLATVSHNGAWAGYRAQLERYPAHHTTVVVLCNAASANPNKLARDVADIVLDKHLAPRPATPAPSATPAVKLSTAELDAWTGTYRDAATGVVFTVTRPGDALVVESGGRRAALEPTTKRTFKIKGTEIAIELDGAAPKRKLVVRGPGVEETYGELVLYTPTATELAAYAGRYHSPELATEWTLSIKNGALVANGRRLVDSPLAPSARDELSITAVDVRLAFTRGPRGVTGFAASTGSLRGIRFDRAP
jgi:CubicO group peptidase (beta-lactamase class C family)